MDLSLGVCVEGSAAICVACAEKQASSSISPSLWWSLNPPLPISADAPCGCGSPMKHRAEFALVRVKALFLDQRA